MSILYTAVVAVQGGREGRATSSDKVLDLPLAMATELGGKGGNATNPEQLFAAGYAACFESALRLAARTNKTALGDVRVVAHVSLSKTDADGFQLATVLHGSFSGIDRDSARRLMSEAHQICPYSKATRGSMNVELVVD